MFDIRLRKYSPAGVKGGVLQTLAIDATDAESATAALTFSTSSRIAERLEAPFVVGLEYTTGASWSRPRNDLYIVLEDAENASDQTDVMQFTAQSYVGWLLSQGIHWWNWDSKDGRTRFYDMTPGKLVRQFLYEAQVDVTGIRRGWAPMLTTDVTDAKDSLGQPWLPTDQIKMSLDLWRPYSAFFQTWSDQGHFEWWAEGTKLRLARVGSGVDRTASLALGGPGFKAAPAKTNFGGTFTRIVLIPDGTIALGADNVDADSRFGALETSMTLSGVSDSDTALRQAQPVMQENRAKKVELSYDWSPGNGRPIPWQDFTIGDTVTARRKTAKQPQRVIGIQVSKRENTVDARAIVGSKLVGLQTKLAKRVGSVAQGTIIGGSGSALPSNPGVAPSAPAQPDAVRAEANVGSWREDGTAVAAVRVAWNAVTTSADGTAIDVDLYEIASRSGAGELQTDTFTQSLSATVETWTPGVPRYVAVRARSVAGIWSAFSEEIGVTPATPSSIVPTRPEGLHVLTNVGSFQVDGSAIAAVAVEWEPVTRSVDDTLIEVGEYELRYGLNSQRVTEPRASFTVPSGRTIEVTVRALTTLGVWGDPSATLEVTGAVPAASLAAPSVPILTTGVSTVSGVWDGKIGDSTPPAGFGHVRMETASELDGPWSPVGTPLVTAGGAVIRSTMGATVHVRLTSYDTLGRVGATSPVASIVAEGVDGDNIVAGTIEVNHVSPAFGNDLQISANSSVQIIVGRQDEQASSLATLEDGVEGA
ncbi:hypothetical protein, partial [Microbacterium sp. H6]|uniref:hypothetical protein n=1 Tax=Microbacterium sp. H6 TaxID=421122 RepID=UPI000DFD8A79